MKVIIMTVMAMVALVVNGQMPNPQDLFLEEWKEFKLTYNKNYQTKEEEAARMKIFAEAKARVAMHNQAHSRGEQTFVSGINQYSDMTLEEFNNKINGFKPSIRKSRKIINATNIQNSKTKLPQYKDWREEGAVTDIKNQYNCASCWAFSATGALESHYFVKEKVLIPLSEQNLIDCTGQDTPFNNDGCFEGDVDTALQYVYCNGGINSEESYPYEACQQQCRYNNTTSRVRVKNIHHIPEGSEKELAKAVALYGPVSVGVDASHISFKEYSHGIYFEENCNPESLTHAMLVVGYGTDRYSELEYWLVKNSYGVTWGEKGYMKLARNTNNHCGIASAASYPILMN